LTIQRTDLSIDSIVVSSLFFLPEAKLRLGDKLSLLLTSGGFRRNQSIATEFGAFSGQLNRNQMDVSAESKICTAELVESFQK
jgi:hypothetical protein